MNWPTPVEVLPSEPCSLRYETFSRCNAALAASGSVTTQLMAARVPVVVGYRCHPITEWIIRQQNFAIRHVSLANIVMEKEVIPECLFAECTPERLSKRVSRLLTSAKARGEQEAAAHTFLQMLSHHSAPTQSHLKSTVLHAKLPFVSTLLSASLQCDGVRPSLVAANAVLGAIISHRACRQSPNTIKT
ncbi:hypothetical protein CYMTET_55711 [Cymbomonas tetramitiformis]|uniref:lipid-A-disaccharide synthase n=1 Tax=Cymbomonas tetramitiformis TaxID=36881 RepID=A0AAE0BDV0_9CHLO|nr:hypothetical protein CYMTET_55711 [Cymbomonas tetramitiformis]